MLNRKVIFPANFIAFIGREEYYDIKLNNTPGYNIFNIYKKSKTNIKNKNPFKN